jgi:CheY-like chemotaxis protein
VPSSSAPVATPAKGLPSRLFALWPVLAVLPVVTAALFLFFLLRGEIASHLRADLLRVATSLTAVLETELAADTRALEALAASPSAAQGELTAFRQEAQRLLAQQPGWLTLALVDAERQVMNLRFPAGAALPPASELPSGPVLQTGRGSPAILPDGQVALRLPVRVDGALRYALVAVLPHFSLAQAMERAALPPGFVALVVDEGRVIAQAGDRSVPVGRLPLPVAAPGQVAELGDGVLATARAMAGAPWHVVIAAPLGHGLWELRAMLIGAFGASALFLILGIALQRRRRAAEPGAAPARGATPERRAELLAEFGEAMQEALAVLRKAQDTMARSDLPFELRRQLNLARQGGEAAEAVAADMMDVARLEAGAIAIEDADIDLPALCEECVAALRARGVEISLATDPGLPRWVRGDPRRLRRVLLAMLRHVASPAGGRFLLSARLAPRPSAIEVSVGPAEPTPGEPGGAGPAIGRLLSGAMGGSLTTSEGGRLSLRLPFRPGAPPAPPGRGARILVAEDVPAARLLLAAVLERGGHQVTSAADGARALAAMHSAAFDLLILDLHMPGMDGFGVAAAVRAMPGEAGRLPILALTADPPEEVEAQCRDAGFDAVLQKPFETRRMLGMVEALRSRGDAAGRERSPAAAG